MFNLVKRSSSAAESSLPFLKCMQQNHEIQHLICNIYIATK